MPHTARGFHTLPLRHGGVDSPATLNPLSLIRSSDRFSPLTLKNLPRLHAVLLFTDTVVDPFFPGLTTSRRGEAIRFFLLLVLTATSGAFLFTIIDPLCVVVPSGSFLGKSDETATTP